MKRPPGPWGFPDFLDLDYVERFFPMQLADSKLLRAYLEELYWCCYKIYDNTNQIFNKFTIETDKVYISTEIDWFDKIYSTLSYASKVNEIISFYKPGKIHKDRAKYFKNILIKLSITEIINKKVRNTVEHYAEYLDDINKVISSLRNNNRYFVAFNLIISNWVAFDDPDFPYRVYKTPQLQYPIYPIRVYIAAEKKFYNMNWSIDLSLLHDEAFQIINNLKPNFNEESPENWCSSLQVL
jgi:hypothetical protein